MEPHSHRLPTPPYAWHRDCWQQFVSAHAENKLPHALIVSAQPGLGITKLALAMGQYLLCAEKKSGSACGHCKNCLLLDAGTHPDLKVVQPEEKSTQLKVDQIREVNAYLSQTSQQGDYKVVLLSPAHAMNQNAANALLKNLEEPAGDTLFVLVTSEVQKLLPTIRSRCRHMLVKTPAVAEVSAWLEGQGVKDAGVLLEIVGNRPLTALDWHNNDSLKEHGEIITSIQGLLERTTSTRAVSKLWAGVDAVHLCELLLIWLESNIRKFSLAQKKSSDIELLFRFGDSLRQKRAFLDSTANINASLVLDEIIFDLVALGRVSRLF